MSAPSPSSTGFRDRFCTTTRPFPPSRSAPAAIGDERSLVKAGKLVDDGDAVQREALPHGLDHAPETAGCLMHFVDLPSRISQYHGGECLA